MQEVATGTRCIVSQAQIIQSSLATKRHTHIVVLLAVVGFFHGISCAQAVDTTKAIGDEVQWTEYQDIETDDCVSIPFVGTTCHHVTYKFEFRGRVASIDHQEQEYNVSLTSRKVIPQETVSPMYWTYKDRAQQWADEQTYRTVGFSDIE